MRRSLCSGQPAPADRPPDSGGGLFSWTTQHRGVAQKVRAVVSKTTTARVRVLPPLRPSATARARAGACQRILISTQREHSGERHLAAPHGERQCSYSRGAAAVKGWGRRKAVLYRAPCILILACRHQAEYTPAKRGGRGLRSHRGFPSVTPWGLGAAGSASAWHAEGRVFESRRLHAARTRAHMDIRMRMVRGVFPASMLPREPGGDS